MKAASFQIEPLSGNHDRSQFLSGSAALDRYFQGTGFTGCQVKRRIATCFVAVSAETDSVTGYYTLSACGVSLSDLPPAITKKLPRYPVVPAVLLGRLAVDRSYQGKGLGAVLLGDALMRTARAELGVFAMVVDAKDEGAQRFYERFGFTLIARWDAPPVPSDCDGASGPACTPSHASIIIGISSEYR